LNEVSLFVVIAVTFPIRSEESFKIPVSGIVIVVEVDEVTTPTDLSEDFDRLLDLGSVRSNGTISPVDSEILTWGTSSDFVVDPAVTDAIDDLGFAVSISLLLLAIFIF